MRFVPLTPSALFSESEARAIAVVAPGQLDRFLQLAEKGGVPARDVGETGGDRLVVAADGATLDASVAELRDAWSTALPRALGL